MPRPDVRIQMEVALDCRSLYWESSGISRMLRNMLVRLISMHPGWQFDLLFNRGEDWQRASQEQIFARPNVRFHCLPSPVPTFKFVLVPVWLQSHRTSVFVSPTSDLLPIRVCPTVLYVHDTIPEKSPELFPFRIRLFGALGLQRAATRAADQVVTVTETSQGEVAKAYGLSPAAIAVVPNPLDDIFRRMEPGETRDVVSSLVGTGTRYVLVINTELMGGFFIAAGKLLEATEPDVRIVLVGRPIYWEGYHQALSAHARSAFLLLGHVTDHELVCLYNQATCFVFPSLHEGFGYPPLEAMACGTPVISYSGSAMDEVLGQAAIMVDPKDPDALTSAMSRLLEDPEERKRLADAGLRHAERFRGDASARQLASVIERVWKRDRRRPEAFGEDADNQGGSSGRPP